MKKFRRGILVGIVLVVAGWFVAREHFARANADRYLSEREIPVYHVLSLHGRDDLNLLGFCRPCGEKARQVIADRVGQEVDATKRDIEHALNGGRK